MDIPAMRASFAKAAAAGDEAPLYFYSHLFLSHPETRQMFPVSMAHQRDRFFTALGDVVTRVDDLDALVPILQQLGRDHRKFGTLAAHYPAVGASLLATLEQNLMIAQSGEEALRLALKNDFAVILLDVRMPGIDGFETARLIRSRERSRRAGGTSCRSARSSGSSSRAIRRSTSRRARPLR